MRSGLRRPAARERAALLSGSSRRSFWPRARALSTAAVTRKMQSKFIDDELKPDFATKVDCSQIRDFGIPFIHGAEDFLVIESALSLDVTAVYTAAPNGGQVSSIDVEQIRERVLR
jgi:hypothetical protein